MKHKLFIRIPVACILGIITTVAVAWGCALWVGVSGKITMSRMQSTRIYSQDMQKEIVTHASYGSMRSVYKDSGIGGAIEVSDLNAEQYSFQSSPNNMPQYKSWMNEFNKDMEVSCVLDSRGWPFHAMYGSFDIDSPDGRGSIDKTYNAIILDIRPQLPGSDKTMTPLLPLAPIWRGFIYNSLIYTALWLILLLLPQIIKARMRNASNRCQICGYDLRGTDHTHCPECGEETKTKKILGK